MNNYRFHLSILAVCLAAKATVMASTIEWSSPPNGFNIESTGEVMGTGFHYELGVFTSGFQPTPSNVADWSDNWHPADGVTRSKVVNAFCASFRVRSNAAPFTAGAKGWIMGKKDSPTGTELILFRNNHWTWPAATAATAAPGLAREWHVDGKSTMDEVILGSVKPEGSPYMMRSAVVRNHGQWKKLQESQGLAEDGETDLLSFVFDTGRPEDRGKPAITPISKAQVNGQEHLQIEIPRNRAHLAKLKVQVSSDLVNWVDGPEYTEVVSEGPLGLIVRDKTPASVHKGGRFMRVQIEPTD